MKQFLVALMLLVGALVQFKCYGHGLQHHIEDAKEVFNGYNEDRVSQNQEEVSFHRYYERFSFELDVYKRTDENTLCWYMRKALKNKFKCDVLHGGHRAYGHGWSMGAEKIPEETVDALEQKHSGAANVVAKVWKDFCERHYGYANELLGFGSKKDKRAKAFSSIVHCIHLLGDREPGNKRVRFVMPTKDLIKEISSQAAILFGDEKFGNEVKVVLDKVRNETIGSDKEKARAVLGKLKTLEFGTKLHNKWGQQFENRPGCKWNSSAQTNSSSR